MASPRGARYLVSLTRCPGQSLSDRIGNYLRAKPDADAIGARRRFLDSKVSRRCFGGVRGACI
jgi:hypothetical protein